MVKCEITIAIISVYTVGIYPEGWKKGNFETWSQYWLCNSSHCPWRQRRCWNWLQIQWYGYKPIYKFIKVTFQIGIISYPEYFFWIFLCFWQLIREFWNSAKFKYILVKIRVFVIAQNWEKQNSFWSKNFWDKNEKSLNFEQLKKIK